MTDGLMNGPVRRRGRSQSGQAAVETALTLPLFVFVLLGTLQLSLMHQARLMAKYAAYKAVRAGAISSVNMTRMERAAIAVLVPTIKAQRAVFKSSNGTEYLQSLPFLLPNFMFDGAIKYVEIEVCSPTKAILSGGNELDFDSESATGSDLGRSDKASMTDQGWKNFDRGRLSIQLTYNYRMPVPFADMMIYYIATNQERADLMWAFKLGKQDPMVASQMAKSIKYAIAASQGQYVLPIRANYVMRMQSNLFPNASGHQIPAQNNCAIRFPKSGSSSGTYEDDDTDPEAPL